MFFMAGKASQKMQWAAQYKGLGLDTVELLYKRVCGGWSVCFSHVKELVSMSVGLVFIILLLNL